MQGFFFKNPVRRRRNAGNDGKSAELMYLAHVGAEVCDHPWHSAVTSLDLPSSELEQRDFEQLEPIATEPEAITANTDFGAAIVRHPTFAEHEFGAKFDVPFQRLQTKKIA